jgi:hypothetical protein
MESVHADAEMFMFSEDMQNHSPKVEDLSIHGGNAFKHLFMQYRRQQHDLPPPPHEQATDMELPSENERLVDQLLACLPAEHLSWLAPLRLDARAAPAPPAFPSPPAAAVPSAKSTAARSGQSKRGLRRLLQANPFRPDLATLTEEGVAEAAWSVSHQAPGGGHDLAPRRPRKTLKHSHDENIALAHLPHVLRTAAFLQKGKDERAARASLKAARPRITLGELSKYVSRNPSPSLSRGPDTKTHAASPVELEEDVVGQTLQRLALSNALTPDYMAPEHLPAPLPYEETGMWSVR